MLYIYLIKQYNDDNYIQRGSFSRDACREFLLMRDNYVGSFVEKSRDWPSAMPWLYYETERADQVLTRYEHLFGFM